MRRKLYFRTHTVGTHAHHWVHVLPIGLLAPMQASKLQEEILERLRVYENEITQTKMISINCLC